MKKKSGHRRRTKVVRRSRKNLRRTNKRKRLVKGRRRPTRRYSRIQRGGMTEDAEYYYKIGKAWQYHEDYAKAVRWYSLAAEKGHAGAQFNLGIMFQIGLGVGFDFAEAARLYHLAAAQGHAEAAYALGIMYENDLGGKWHNSDAMQWYIEASKLGNADAKKELDRF